LEQRQALESTLPVAVDDQLTTGAALATPTALTETIPDFDRCPNQSKQHCVKGERLLAAARQQPLH